jgi:hypothetical protein
VIAVLLQQDRIVEIVDEGRRTELCVLHDNSFLRQRRAKPRSGAGMLEVRVPHDDGGERFIIDGHAR